MANIFEIAKKLRKQDGNRKPWQKYVQMASKEVKKAPAKKVSGIAKRTIAGTKKKTAPVKKVTVFARTAKVAGIGCTSKSAMQQLNQVSANIEQAKKIGEDLKQQKAAAHPKEKRMYQKEIENNKKLIQSLTAAKRSIKVLV